MNEKDLMEATIKLNVEKEIANASETMEIQELFTSVAERGGCYSSVFVDGFWVGCEIAFRYEISLHQAMDRVYNDLKEKWGLPTV